MPKRIRLMALGLVLAVPAAALAQSLPQGRDRDRDRDGGRRDRYEVIIINNWDRDVEVSITAERRDEDVRETWNIAPRANTWLVHENGRRIRVRGTDRIKVRRDMRSVRISEVGELRDGRWTISVRDVVREQRDKERR
ncbi:MAG: hypothetical protein ABIR26_07600 [Ramlibacter sp.]